MSTTHYLVLSAILFCIGLYGVLSRRNAVMVLLSIEIMLCSAGLNFACFSALYSPAGQIFALFIIVVSAAEVACGLAIFFLSAKLSESIDLDKFNLLKG